MISTNTFEKVKEYVSNLIDSITKPFITSVKERTEDPFIGPFLCASLLVFWEVPILLIYKEPKPLLDLFYKFFYNTEFQQPIKNVDHRLWLIFLSWLLWVFVFPILGQYLYKLRTVSIEKAKEHNKFETYAKYVTLINQLEKKADTFEKRNSQLEGQIGALRLLVTNHKEKYKYIFEIQKKAVLWNPPFNNKDIEVIDKINKKPASFVIPNSPDDESIQDLYEKNISTRTFLMVLKESGDAYNSLVQDIENLK